MDLHQQLQKLQGKDKVNAKANVEVNAKSKGEKYREEAELRYK